LLPLVAGLVAPLEDAGAAAEGLARYLEVADKVQAE
jgi:hypothetical protein